MRGETLSAGGALIEAGCEAKGAQGGAERTDEELTNLVSAESCGAEFAFMFRAAGGHGGLGRAQNAQILISAIKSMGWRYLCLGQLE